MINLFGLHLQLMLGETLPTPAPLKVSEALQSVEVTAKDSDRSGFQMVFQVGRGLADRKDFALLAETKLQPFNRVVLSVLFGVTPQPIMDGIITKHQLAPSDEPGASKLTVTGEDVSVMMDLEKVQRPYPQLGDNLIVGLILIPYMIDYGIVPQIMVPSDPLVRPVTEQTRSQTSKETDRDFITKLAAKHGFVFYVEPGPTPLANFAYWGPPPRLELPQPALSVNMGPGSNVETMSFSYNELSPKALTYTKSDGSSETVDSYSRQPPLAARVPDTRQSDFLGDGPDGETDAAKRVRAQGEVDKSFDNVVTAEGTLDALRYGRILKPRSLVDVRGAGDSFDGRFYVKSVTHTIDVKKGLYKQKFSLSREGVGTTTPLVMP
ncbi:hypothetical protein [Halomonas sp. LBP4]|uniref:hypothetical protein n=1 Tax=Halomonas sp. LBP4 TaxID=2044917 RepID=UPI000D768D14|nr:hypothetical protein [Halomonas sp. LBP4]PXX98165.1 hypothetical protein CR157_07475 [Halomonas sp. LBP4]